MSKFNEIDCVCTNYKILSRALSKKYDSVLRAVNINVNQYAILINIERYQPIYQHDLANHLGLDNTTLSRGVKILRDRNLLLVEKGITRNTKLLSLTREGTKTTSKAKKLWTNLHDDIVSKIGHTRWDGIKKDILNLTAFLNE